MRMSETSFSYRLRIDRRIAVISSVKRFRAKAELADGSGLSHNESACHSKSTLLAERQFNAKVKFALRYSRSITFYNDSKATK
jgi:hypothetical protein